MVSKADIVQEARSLINITWEHEGRTIIGIDCVGLIIMVINNLGINLDNYNILGYSRRSNGDKILKEFRENMIQKPILKAEPGDVLLFRDSIFPCHVGIVAIQHGRPSIIHAHATRRKVLEEIMEQGDWLERRVACFQYKYLEI